MSPSWHERIRAVLMPDWISVRRIPRGLRPRPGVPEETEVLADESGLSQATALADCLERLKVRDARIHVVLAGEFVRLAVLPAGKLAGEAQRQALARIVFRRIHGAAAEGWTVCLSPAGKDEPVLACAVESELVDALKVACAPYGRLTSLRPVWMEAANRYRRDMAHGSGSFALIEPGRLTLASLKDGRWSDMVGRRLPKAAQDVSAIFAEHLALMEAPTSPTLWLCDLTGTVRPSLPAPWALQRLPLPAGVRDAGDAITVWEGA